MQGTNLMPVMLDDAAPRETSVVSEVDASIEKREGVTDNEHDSANWVEYWLDGELVHRSVHVTIKKGHEAGGVIQALIS
jgi:hypothetical protein